jgi:hypothetical protein
MKVEKQRHGCLTTWLVLTIIVNLVSVPLLYWSLTTSGASTSAWLLLYIGFNSIVLVGCAIALFKWKKWGFYGIAIWSVIGFIVNLIIGYSFYQALFGLLAIAILYGVLQIGGDQKGWSQLE